MMSSRRVEVRIISIAASVSGSHPRGQFMRTVTGCGPSSVTDGK